MSKNRRILVVDDNQEIHGDFRKILCPNVAAENDLDAAAADLFGNASEEGPKAVFELEFASQGKEAFEKIQIAMREGRPFAMAFIDVRMPPGWDGIETTRKIWEVDPDLQVVICTAYSDYSWASVSNQLNHSDKFVVLKKPFDVIEVLQLANAFTAKWNLTKEVLDRARHLQENEKRYRCLANALPGILWTATPEGGVDFSNQRLEEYSGVSGDELAGTGWQRLLHPDDSANALSRWTEAVQNGTAYEIEYRLKRASDGAYRWHLGRAVPMRDEQGGILQWIGTCTDIEDQKRAEEVLRQTQSDLEKRVAERTHELSLIHSRLEHLLRSSSSMIYSIKLGEEPCVSFLSDNVARILGYEPAEFMDNPRFWIDHLDPDDRANIPRYRLELLAVGQNSIQYRFRHKDGSYRWLHDDARIILDAQGFPGEVVGSWIDITDRKQSEEALRASEERFRQLAETIREVFWMAAPDLEQVMYVSPAYAEIWGRSIEDLYRKPLDWTEAIVPEDRERVVKVFRELGAARSSCDLEYRIRRPDGTVRWIRDRGFQVRNDQGQVYRLAGLASDITERKKAEETLQLQTSALRASYNGVAITDRQGIIAWVNPALCRMTGYTPEELIGSTPALLKSGVQDARFYQELWTTINSGKPWHGELVNRRKDGSHYFEEMTITPVLGENGAIQNFVAIKKDISQRKEFEKALSRERDLLQSLMDNLPDFIYFKDAQSRFTRINLAHAHYLGLSNPQDAIGKTDADFFPGQFAKQALADERRLIATGEPMLDQLEELSTPHGVLWVSATKVPIHGPDGQITGLVGVSRDITERRRVEQELRTQRESFRALTDNVPDGILRLGRDLHLVYVNQVVEHIMGIPASRLLNGNNGHTVLPAHETWTAAARRVFQTGQTETFEFQCETLLGVRFCEVRLVPEHSQQGKVEYVLALTRDVTARKKAEQERQFMELQLRQAQKLESIGQLAAGIAHEINTPTQYVGDNTRFLKDAFDSMVKVLKAYEELLRDTKGSAVKPEVITQVEAELTAADLGYLFEQVPAAIRETLEGVDRVSKIVRAMKEFSHPGSKEKVAADLNKAIESTVTVARNEWKYVSDLVMDLDPALPPVPCLVGEFNQVILNLIVNASHAIADVVKQKPGTKGKITVSTRRDGDWVEVRVADTGTGIPEAVRSHIFEPFFTTKEVGKGTGQGLSIVYGSIVKKHGGTVTFETETGKGTTFIIRLPLAPRSADTEIAAIPNAGADPAVTTEVCA